MPWTFIVVQILFWIALSTWFGAVLFVAVAPRIIQKTVRESNPILPTVLSVNLEGQHGTLLAGTVVAALMLPLQKLELACSGLLLLAIIGQWVVLTPTGSGTILPIMRTAMYFAATVLLIYDWRVVWPRILSYRQQYLDHVDEPEVANPALDQCEKYQRESEMILQFIMGLLIGLILFSASMTYTWTIPGAPSGTHAQAQ
jgi:hypothetical protein